MKFDQYNEPIWEEGDMPKGKLLWAGLINTGSPEDARELLRQIHDDPYGALFRPLRWYERLGVRIKRLFRALQARDSNAD